MSEIKMYGGEGKGMLRGEAKAERMREGGRGGRVTHKTEKQ